jgi:O-antigen ligase
MYIQFFLLLLSVYVILTLGIIPFLFSFSISSFTIWGELLKLLQIKDGFNIIIWLGLFTTVFLISIFRNKEKRQPLSGLIKKLIIPWIIFLVYLFIRTFIPGEGFIEYGLFKSAVFFLKGVFPAVLFIIWLNNREEELQKLELILFIFGFFLSLLTLYNYYIFHEVRTSVLGINPIWLARYIAIGLIAVINLSFKYYYKILLGIILFMGILATGSRGPLLMLLLVLFIRLILYFKGKYPDRGYLPLMLVFVLILISASIYFAFLQDFFTRGSVNILQEYNVRERIDLYREAFANFICNPIFGSGTGTFNYQKRNYPHNIILELLTETGLIGLILFIYALKPGETFNFRYRFSDYFVFAFLSSLLSGDIGKNSFIVPLCFLVLISRNLKRGDQDI